MALADSQLYQLASFDPYTTMVQAPMQRRQAEMQAMETEQAYKEMQAEMGQQPQGLSQMSGQLGQPQAQQPAPLASMAKSIFGTTDVKLENPDGTQTEAGRISDMFGNKVREQQRSQQLDAQATQLMRNAKQFRFSDPAKFGQLMKQASDLSAEARRADNAGNIAGEKLQEKWNDVLTGGLLSIATANQNNYKSVLQDWENRTGIPVPAYVPKQYDKEAISKFLQNPQIPQKVRAAVETELDKEATRKHNEKMRPLLENKATLDVREKILDIAKKSQSAANETPAQSRVIQALTQTSDALQNVANLEITTTGPMFQQKQFGSLYTAPLSALNQKLSDESSQMLQTRMTGVARGLAALESGGAATGLVGLTESIEKGTFIQAGSKLNVALDKLGEMRRIVESSAKAMLNDPKLSPERKQLIQDELSIVQKAIPFTQADIDRARKQSKKNPNMSFTEFTTANPPGGAKPQGAGTKEDPIKLD